MEVVNKNFWIVFKIYTQFPGMYLSKLGACWFSGKVKIRATTSTVLQNISGDAV